MKALRTPWPGFELCIFCSVGGYDYHCATQCYLVSNYFQVPMFIPYSGYRSRQCLEPTYVKNTGLIPFWIIYDKKISSSTYTNPGKWIILAPAEWWIIVVASKTTRVQLYNFCIYIQLQRQRCNRLECLKSSGKYFGFQNALGYSWRCEFLQHWRCNSWS
jgi:hypothetical protein